MTTNSMTEIPEIKNYKAKQKARTNKETNKQKRFISLIPCYLHTLFPHAFNQSANWW